ncbi:30S ribosomal protein S1, chloroplastic, partial [Tetrabaena socialis]
EGGVVAGSVKLVTQHLAVVDLGGGLTGSLTRSQFSHGCVERLHSVLKEGDRMKALVLKLDRALGLAKLSTRVLEATPGDMLRAPQLVYDKAEDAAKVLREKAEQASLANYAKWGRWMEEHKVIRRSGVHLPPALSCASPPAAQRRPPASSTYVFPARCMPRTPQGPSRARSSPHTHQVDELLEGVVQSVERSGAVVNLGDGFCGWLPEAQVSQVPVEDVEKVLQVGQRVKALIRSLDPMRSRVELSTQELEPTPGDMLWDPQRVYDRAKTMRELYLDNQRGPQGAHGQEKEAVREDRTTSKRPLKAGQLKGGVLVSWIGPAS